MRVVIPEITRNSKIASDEEVIKVLKKMIENAKLCGNLQEIPILESYLPQAMPEEEIKSILESIIAENGFIQKDLGKIMGKAKVALGSDFDGTIVSKLITSIFA